MYQFFSQLSRHLKFKNKVYSMCRMFAVVKKTCSVDHMRSDEYISIWSTKVIELVDNEPDAKDRLMSLHLQHLMKLDDSHRDRMNLRYNISPFEYMDISNIVDVIEDKSKCFSFNYMKFKEMKDECTSQGVRELFDALMTKHGKKTADV